MIQTFTSLYLARNFQQLGNRIEIKGRNRGVGAVNEGIWKTDSN